MDLKTRLILKSVFRDSGCIEWTGAKRGRSGYGAIKIQGKVQQAHRVSYEVYIGPIPEGLFVCHTCDNRICINPEHLFVGTNSDNMRDCAQKGRLKVPEGSKFSRGEISHNRKYSKDKVQEAISLFESGNGLTLRKICTNLDVGYQSVRDARRRDAKHWYQK